MAESSSIVYVYHVFLHSSVNGHLNCFHVLAIVNVATVNTGVHVSFGSLMGIFKGPTLCDELWGIKSGLWGPSLKNHHP